MMKFNRLLINHTVNQKVERKKGPDTAPLKVPSDAGQAQRGTGITRTLRKIEKRGGATGNIGPSHLTTSLRLGISQTGDQDAMG